MMVFKPEKLSIADVGMRPFVDPSEIWGIINTIKPRRERVREIIAKSLAKERLTLAETAALINTKDPTMLEEIKVAATKLKEEIYGNRIVLFAPLYVGNKCNNNCKYCGFSAININAVRKTLTDDEITDEVEALEVNGQKRLILVFGDHPDYSPEYISHVVKHIYSIKNGNGQIRRLNINAKPFDIDGFKMIKKEKIGTYQVFQETYHPGAYKSYHPKGNKSNYDYRLTALDRAMEAGIDDVGIGALFGLYDWRFEVLGLVRHANHLEACYNVGPHTISFPRLQPAAVEKQNYPYKVSDEHFIRLVAVLRLAIPYTGLILTARENPEIRREAMHYGVSQIDGGTRIELGGYSQTFNESQDLNREQFFINDSRSLDEIVREMLEGGHLPSFCTACYRKGRTGELFMEQSVPGFINNYCTPNAILTLAEYLMDYALPETYNKGWEVIGKNLEGVKDTKTNAEISHRLEKIKNGARDLFF